MPSVDALLGKIHRGESYQCGHFVRDAWKHLTGDDLSDEFEGFLLPVGERTALKGVKARFKRVSRPVRPCVAVFRRLSGRPHVGMWYKGKILELSQSGAAYVPLHVVSRRFTSVRFYEPVN